MTLFLLRLATNKLIPANVDVPHWANLACGFPVGAAGDEFRAWWSQKSSAAD